MKHKMQPFFGRSIQQRCEYCEHSATGRCQLGRSFPEDGCCNRFRYDPLRRVPQVRPPLPKLNPNDFKL